LVETSFTPRLGPMSDKRPDTRERIRQAALRLFVEKGYRGTSIADIEAAAGLAPRTGGFYRHFPGKAELAAEIGETCIIETADELGLDGFLPLGDTRAELVLIAKGYAKAFARQAPLASLITEVQELPQIIELQNRVDLELTDLLMGWLADKPYGRGMNAADLMALLLSIFGGWIFFLSKQSSKAGPPGFSDETMLNQWANFWAGILEGPPPTSDVMSK